MRRSEVLDRARDCVTRDRAATHGRAEDVFGLIAAYWSADMGVPVSALDVARMMGLFKLARAKGNPGHADNWVDLAGYAAIGGELGGLPAWLEPIVDEDLPNGETLRDTCDGKSHGAVATGSEPMVPAAAPPPSAPVVDWGAMVDQVFDGATIEDVASAHGVIEHWLVHHYCNDPRAYAFGQGEAAFDDYATILRMTQTAYATSEGTVQLRTEAPVREDERELGPIRDTDPAPMPEPVPAAPALPPELQAEISVGVLPPIFTTNPGAPIADRFSAVGDQIEVPVNEPVMDGSKEPEVPDAALASGYPDHPDRGSCIEAEPGINGIVKAESAAVVPSGGGGSTPTDPCWMRTRPRSGGGTRLSVRPWRSRAPSDSGKSVFSPS